MHGTLAPLCGEGQLPSARETLHHMCLQVEIDFKAECQAGNVIDSLCHPLGPEQPQQGENQGAEPCNGASGSAAATNGAHGASSKSSGNSDGSSSGTAAPPQHRFLHSLRRCDDRGCYELVRCRTKWQPVENRVVGIELKKLEHGAVCTCLAGICTVSLYWQ